MENQTLAPQFLGMEKEEGGILHEVDQLLKYIYGAPTIDRHQLATTVLGIAHKCLNSVNNEKVKVTLLEEQVEILHEQLQIAQNNQENAEALDDLTTEKVDEPLIDFKNCTIKKTIYSSTSAYEVQALLGQGCYGAVFQCWKTPANRTVALKVIKDKSSIELAMKELRTLESLKALDSTDFNIVSCNEAFTCDGHLCLEFDKLDMSLQDYISNQGSLELQKIRPIIQQMTEALGLMKIEGVFHSDIKPDNVMLVDQSQQPLKLQVIDFGLACHNPKLYQGQVFQSLSYRAPEVLLGAPFSHSIDVWSLGCMAAELLRGTLLFPAHDEYDMMRCIVSAVGLPPDLMLQLGLYTDNYFLKSSSSQQPEGWTLKEPVGGSPKNSSAECTQGLHGRLADLLKAPAGISTEEDQAVECDRIWFIDLVTRMLNPNNSERISPSEILAHPFLTMSHLNQEIYSSYLSSSLKHMEVCGTLQFDGGNSVEQPSSSTTSCNKNDHLTSDHSPSELSSVKQYPTQEARRLSRKRHLDQLKCADEEGCTTSQCYVPPRKLARINSPTTKSIEFSKSPKKHCSKKKHVTSGQQKEL